MTTPLRRAALLKPPETPSMRRPTDRYDRPPDLPLKPYVSSATKSPGEVALLPGAPTRVWRFTGEQLAGPTGTLTMPADSYLGPTIRLRRGQRVRIRFQNRLGEDSIVHWHGLRPPEHSDGHPRFAIAPGTSYSYDFEVNEPAALYWYHPHAHMRTAVQAYMASISYADYEVGRLLAETPPDTVIVVGGAYIGILSGLFGVGGGFLLTPLLMQIGIPPAVAVASAANQVVGASVSGCIAHWQRGNVDIKMGVILLGGGFAGVYTALSCARPAESVAHRALLRTACAREFKPACVIKLGIV